MVEKSIGVTKENYVRTQKTKEGGSVVFAYSANDTLANTVGHVLAVPLVHLPLLTFKNIFETPPKDLVDRLSERWKDVPWKGDVLVRVGHTSIVGDIQRLLASDEDLKGRPRFSTLSRQVDRIARVLYIPIQVLKSVSAKVFRADNYDPITNTVNVFHPNLAVGMHELGHAQFLEQQKKTEGWVFFYGWPVIRSFTEWKASANAMKQFKSDAERRQALKVLEPAWGTYIAPDVFSLAGARGLEKLGSIGGLIAGHLMARLYPKKDERFDYIFEGKTAHEVPKAPVRLGARQVLVARAKA